MSARLEQLWFPRPEEGLGRKLALAPLLLPSTLFGAGVWVRNRLYDRGVLKASRVTGAFVVSIGNVTVGGSGKTPAVIHLANLFLKHGKRPAVLSRGYGRSTRKSLVLNGSVDVPYTDAGDEPLTIAHRCPGVPVLVGADRLALARRAVGELGADVLLLDDGMQHRRLARDLEIAVVDGEAMFGNEHLLPRGPLREPAKSLSRAHLLWVVERQTPSTQLPSQGIPTVRATYRPSGLKAPDGRDAPLNALAGQEVIALCGVARPSRFGATLSTLGMRIEHVFFFTDHHRFRPAELEKILAISRTTRTPIVTTEKDRVRLPKDFPAWVVVLGVKITAGENLLLARLKLP